MVDGLLVGSRSIQPECSEGKSVRGFAELCVCVCVTRGPPEERTFSRGRRSEESNTEDNAQ